MTGTQKPQLKCRRSSTEQWMPTASVKGGLGPQRVRLHQGDQRCLFSQSSRMMCTSPSYLSVAQAQLHLLLPPSSVGSPLREHDISCASEPSQARHRQPRLFDASLILTFALVAIGFVAICISSERNRSLVSCVCVRLAVCARGRVLLAV